MIVEAHGFSGGIWLMWNRDDFQIQLVKDNNYYLHVRVVENDYSHWLLTVVYASPREHERAEIWDNLRNLANSISEPWLMLGDFNEIVGPEEKKGGAPIDLKMCFEFANWINDCHLLEVTTVGTKFTWRGPKWEGRDRIFKKLDKVLCNVEWRTHFHEAFAKVPPRIQSNHHPIVVMSEGAPRDQINHPFRFESTWLAHEDFNRLLKDSWGNGTDLVNKLGELTPQLKSWNKDIFGNIFRRKKLLIAQINGIHNSSSYGYSNFLDLLEKDLQQQLEQTLYQEECLWFQKSRGKWIADGDRNTKYYHSKTITRRKQNRVWPCGLRIGVGRRMKSGSNI